MINPDELLDAFARQDFFLEYLPTISLTDGRCVGAEALTRWRKPTGIASPKDFIPLMENTPLSGLLTYWVMDTVAAEMGDWLRSHRNGHISINVPPEILGRGGLLYTGNKSGLIELGSQIILELTERGLPDALAVNALNSAHILGIQVALDDVTLVNGANAAVLARCNFDIVKLDRSLIAQIRPNYPAPEWLGSIAALLESSRLVVTAEGIETKRNSKSWRSVRPMSKRHKVSTSRPRYLPRLS
jgi:sensor c-di-GMP phosphodiesterase-like protein